MTRIFGSKFCVQGATISKMKIQRVSKLCKSFLYLHDRSYNLKKLRVFSRKKISKAASIGIILIQVRRINIASNIHNNINGVKQHESTREKPE